MQDSQQKRTDSDEIDLRQLFSAIGNFFTKIGNGIVNSIIRIKRNTFKYKWVIIVTIISGVFMGVLYTVKSDPVYESSLLLSSTYFNNTIIEDGIEKLNRLSLAENKQGLANALGIDLETADKIVGFSAIPSMSANDLVEMELLKERLSELELSSEEVERIISLGEKNAYRITVEVNESTMISAIENSIINYFKSNPYILNRIKINEQNLIARKEKLLQEDQKLDTLKKAIISVYKSMSNRSTQGSNNLYLGEQYSTNPMEIFREDLRINEEILKIDEKLYLDSDFELIDGMVEFSEPVNKQTLSALFYATLISLGVAYFIIILLSINEYLERVERERFS